MPRMTESELKALLHEEINQALSYSSGDLSKDRATAMDYYLGKPFGNEEEGRSQVVSTDVADTIQWILPALLRIFAGGDETVRFDPRGPEDEAAAKQATDYVNWIFNRDNPGFLILYTIMTDALLQKNGYAKVWWEETEETREDPLPAPIDALEEQALRDAIEKLPSKPELVLDKADDAGLRNGKIMRQVKVERCKVAAIPPEEVLIARRSRTIADSPFVAHRTRMTRSDLVAQGYSRKIVDDLPEAGALERTIEAAARRSWDDEAADALSTRGHGMDEVWITEAYIRVDWDGDGIAEMRKVTAAGDGTVILDNEPWDTETAPIITLSPILMTHRLIGISIADLVMDLQLIKSTVLRQILDNFYLSNNARMAVSDKVNLDDMLTARPGGIVRLKESAIPGEGHVFPLVVPQVAAAAMPLLEYIDTIRENRTGVTRYNQGIDASSLNKTASGITQIMTAAQQRIDLIARVFAETGIKDLFRLILRTVSMHQSEARMIRISEKEWIPINPREWRNQFDLNVTVGIGSGGKEQQAAALMNILGIQTKALEMQGGADGPLVTLANIWETVRRIPEAAGIKPGEAFFTNPANAQTQQQAPKPDPEAMAMQAEMMLKGKALEQDGAIKGAELQQRQQLDGAKLSLEAQAKQAEIELKRAELDLKREELAMKREEAAFKRQCAMADQEMNRTRMEGEMTMKRDAAQAKQPGSVIIDTQGKGIADAEGLLAGAAQLGEQVIAFMDRQGQRDAAQEQSIAALVTALAAPKQKTITGTLPSGASFNATVRE